MLLQSQINVSVIIPAYNVEPYIARGIESCINQSEKNIEIIIVDDGSTDSTYEIAKRWSEKDQRIKCFSKENGGVSSARNYALKKTEAKYVIFLDGDDWLERDAIEQLLKLTDKENCLAMTINRYLITDCNGVLRATASKHIDADVKKISKEVALKNIGTGTYNLQSACYKLFDRTVIQENNLEFNERITHGEDALFVFEYLQCIDGIIYNALPLWCILARDGSASRSGFNIKMLSSLEAIKIMLSYPNSVQTQNALNLYYVERVQTCLSAMIRGGDLKEYDSLVSKIKDKKNLVYGGECSLYRKITYWRYINLQPLQNKAINHVERVIKKVIKALIGMLRKYDK